MDNVSQVQCFVYTTKEGRKDIIFVDYLLETQISAVSVRDNGFLCTCIRKKGRKKGRG